MNPAGYQQPSFHSLSPFSYERDQRTLGTRLVCQLFSFHTTTDKWTVFFDDSWYKLRVDIKRRVLRPVYMRWVSPGLTRFTELARLMHCFLINFRRVHMGKRAGPLAEGHRSYPSRDQLDKLASPLPHKNWHRKKFMRKQGISQTGPVKQATKPGWLSSYKQALML